jgi:hypothetical protein
MSAALETRVASCSRMSAWQPTDVINVTGPGTAITRRPRWIALRAVARVPLQAAAFITTVPHAKAATSRLRAGNLCLPGGVPGGYSLITAQRRAIASNRPECSRG